MKLFRMLMFLMMKKYALSHEDVQMTLCKKEDSKCFNNFVNRLMKTAIDGVAEHNILALDPLRIEFFDFKTPKDVTIHLTDIDITGVKNFEHVDAYLNLKQQTMELQMMLSLKINANMSIEFMAISKSINSIRYKAISNPLKISAEYEFELSPKFESEDYFAVKNEINTKCEITKEPSVGLDADNLDHILREDPELLDQFINLNEKGSKAWKNQLICKIAKQTISRMMDNFSILCGIMQASI